VAGVGGVRDTVVGDLVPGGVLRAAINLGNPVLARGVAAAPAGVTVDIARELGTRLGVEVNLACFTAARESLAAMARGDADICFLAIEPARAAEVAFTTPYVVIEGVFVVPVESAITMVADADRAGVRIGVNRGQLTTCSCPGPCGRPAWCAAGTGSGSSASKAWTPAQASARWSAAS
jgi:polar amino acid transport system substrate-binding protein